MSSDGGVLLSFCCCGKTQETTAPRAPARTPQICRHEARKLITDVLTINRKVGRAGVGESRQIGGEVRENGVQLGIAVELLSAQSFHSHADRTTSRAKIPLAKKVTCEQRRGSWRNGLESVAVPFDGTNVNSSPQLLRPEDRCVHLALPQNQIPKPPRKR